MYSTFKIKEIVTGIEDYDEEYPPIKEFLDDFPHLKDVIRQNNFFPLYFILRERIDDTAIIEIKLKKYTERISKLFDTVYDNEHTSQKSKFVHKIFFILEYLWGSRIKSTKNGTNLLRGDVDDVPEELVDIKNELQQDGLLSNEFLSNIYAINKYLKGCRFKSHYDKFIESVWSYYLGVSSRISFEVSNNESGIGMCSIEIPEGATTEMPTDKFSGGFINHTIKREHIYGERYAALFRTVKMSIYNDIILKKLEKQENQHQDGSNNKKKGRGKSKRKKK